MSMRYAIIILGLCFSMPFAQEAVLAALDSIEENTLGFSLNGRAKAGILSSTLSSDALDEDFSDRLAFSDFLLRVSVRPSNETKATFDLRFHKDWQSAYREGNNSPVIRWWSYDGNILDKKVKFNLGTMRIAYTPLTIYLPEPNLIMEPEIFSELKKEAMEERYLDGTNRRLLQGLNAEFKTSAGFLDKIFAQGTIARLRKPANLEDRISYDIDPIKDRFAMAARIGAEAFGFSLGVNDVYTFSRVGSALISSLEARDTLIDFEKNNVLSFELGYNSKKLSLPVDFGVNAEYAISNWSHSQRKKVQEQKLVLVLDPGHALIPNHTPAPVLDQTGRVIVPANYYPYYLSVTETSFKTDRVEKLGNKSAILANAYVAYNQESLEIKLSGNFLNTDKGFEAELAASPAYLPNLPILNSNAVLDPAFEQFRASSLENMYYSLYYTLPMNAMTIVSGTKGGASAVIGGQEIYNSGNLYNNYKFSQYYRNAYTQQTYTRLERDSLSYLLDPAVNLALPYGYATPDRAGGDANLSLTWNKAVSVSGVFGMYSSEFEDFTRFGGGLEVNIARLAGLGKAMIVSGSYEQSKAEGDFLDINVNRIVAGTRIGIWRGISLLGGFQQISKEFNSANKINEMLVLGGPEIKISERAKASLQAGLLSNSIEVSGMDKLELDKFVMSGIVTVEF